LVRAFSYWLTQTDAASNWLLIKRQCQACRESSSKINLIAQAIGVIFAFTGKKMFYFN
jgi:hypothetical protein